MRVSLRSTILLILIIGIVFGSVVHTAKVQRDAVAAIRQSGGTVRYEWQVTNGQVNQRKEPPQPKWLVGLAGVDLFENVRTVWPNAKVSEAVMVHIGSLNRLQRLILDSSTVTDEDLRHLERLTNLRALYLSDTKVTDAGLAHLDGLRNLEELVLMRTHVSDGGLRHLERMTKLKRSSLMTLTSAMLGCAI